MVAYSFWIILNLEKRHTAFEFRQEKEKIYYCPLKILGL